MKKIHLLIAGLVLACAGAVPATYSYWNTNESIPEVPQIAEPRPDNQACQYGQCSAIAKSTGLRCKHCVSNPGDKYCWQHK